MTMMQVGAGTRPSSPSQTAIARLISTAMEDAIFVFAASIGGQAAALDALGKRRAETYATVIQGAEVLRLTSDFDGWMVELARSMAAIVSPSWMPMSDVIREKVTLEVGARGLRSLFSSKPSDKDVQRVKKLGTLTVRVLRAVLSADGVIDAEEARTISALIASFGLSDADTATMAAEAPVGIETLDVYGEIDPAIAKALVRGAWFAAAWDAIDPREEEIVKTLSTKLALPLEEYEAYRAEAIARIDRRRTMGLATVDGVRYVLSDRTPGEGVTLAAKAGTLMLPRRYREEALAQIGHGTPVSLAKRYPHMTTEERTSVLGIAWASALHEDPTIGRRALLRARHDRLAEDLGDEGGRVRALVDDWLAETIQPFASNLP